MHSLFQSFKNCAWFSIPASISIPDTEMKGIPEDKSLRSGKKRSNSLLGQGRNSYFESAKASVQPEPFIWCGDKDGRDVKQDGISRPVWHLPSVTCLLSHLNSCTENLQGNWSDYWDALFNFSPLSPCSWLTAAFLTGHCSQLQETASPTIWGQPG